MRVIELTQSAPDRVGGRQGNGVSAVDATASQILDLIRERGLGIGDVLPTERELCDLVGASRNTVREALRTIRTYGLIEARQRVGAVLTDRQGAAIRNFLSAHMDVSRSSFRDIQGFRRLVEVGIGDHLVLHMTDADIEALETVNSRILESRSAEQAARYDFEFHSMLIGLAGNRTLAEMYSVPVARHPAHHDDRQGEAPGAQPHAERARRDRRRAEIARPARLRLPHEPPPRFRSPVPAWRTIVLNNPRE